MKFGKHLLGNMPPEWRFNFIDYSGLKYFMKSNVAATAWDDNLEAKFITMLEEELKKVSDFGYVKYNELSRHVQYVEQQINKLPDPATSPRAPELKLEMDGITEDITKLSSFNSLNFTAFVKILKKHDKVTSYKLKHTFLARLTAQPFYKETFDSLIVTLSTLYDRLKPKDKLSEKAPMGEPLTFQKRTTKYWVHPDNITAVKVYILQNLPVLQYKKDPTMGKGYDNTITSVYYDNEQLQHYHDVYEKKDGAQTIRFRYYGATPQEVYVERKTYREERSGSDSLTERLVLKEKHVSGLVAGTFKLEDRVEKMKARGRTEEQINATVQLANEVQGMVASQSLGPAVRTTYHRTAFQHPTDNEVRVTLDTDLVMVREWGKNGDSWCRKDVRAPYDTIPQNELVHFPYAVLEVKVAGGAPVPAWVAELTGGHLVEPVLRFSKFVHGCATLLEKRVRLLPFWLPQMEKDIRKAPKPAPLPVASSSHGDLIEPASTSTFGGLDRQASSLGADDDEEDDDEGDETAQLLGQKKKNIRILSALGKPTSGEAADKNKGKSKPVLAPIKVEPKVYFANERTFLNWLHTAVLISTIGLALLNLAPESKGAKASRIAGLTLIPVAIMFLVYALYTYFWRDRKIKTRDPEPYNTIVGPIAITCVFLGAMVINYIAWFLENGADVSKWD
eukprot:comp24129_c1_seq2/m.43811 comp24129_c1_seq2/g.43811  ORF comp24129_c1_seq2/g.43811 comp24129_c1_seq2/m.43811 type:complete len:676 (-) comp24129_c1_seq2:233-2260(-)